MDFGFRDAAMYVRLSENEKLYNYKRPNIKFPFLRGGT